MHAFSDLVGQGFSEFVCIMTPAGRPGFVSDTVLLIYGACRGPLGFGACRGPRWPAGLFGALSIPCLVETEFLIVAVTVAPYIFIRAAVSSALI